MVAKCGCSECSSKQLMYQKDNAELVRIGKVVAICPAEVKFASGVQTSREALYGAVFSLLDMLQKALSLVL